MTKEEKKQLVVDFIEKVKDNNYEIPDVVLNKIDDSFWESMNYIVISKITASPHWSDWMQIE